MKSASVSVLLSTFNRARYLPECLESLLAQTVPAHEILVVDDGSEDGTAEIVARYGDRIRYLWQPNAGKAVAINRALSNSSGEWVWLFDDDDVAEPDAIERRLVVAEAHPQADWIYGTHLLGSDGRDSHIVRGQLYKPPQPSEAAFFLELMASCFFHLNSSLVRRSCYERIGGFDPAMLRGQDYDVQIRLARHYAPVYCASPVFVFRQHAGPRGPRIMRSETATRATVFRRFSADLGKKIRADVPLQEFCVPRRHDGNDREALLNRMHVMANHGCVQEMLDDLEALAMLADRDGGLTAPETEAIARAVCRGWAEPALAEQWPAVLERLQAVRKHQNGRTAIVGLSKGFLRLARSYPGDSFKRLNRLARSARLALASWM